MSANLHADIVGRDADLAGIGEILDLVGSLPAAILIEGEAGIGKTTVWRAAVKLARSRGYRVLAASPAEAESGLAYVVLSDLLEAVDERVFAALPANQARALRVALLRDSAEGRAPDVRVISTGLGGVLRTLARDAPVIVAVDDVHWLDAPSASVLEFAARRLGSSQILFLLGLRGQHRGPVPLALDRALGDRVTRIGLGPLGLGAVHHLLVTRLGLAMPRPTLRRVHTVSAGNPFFALEIGRSLASRGKPLALGDVLPVPSTLNELVRDRLALLPSDTGDALLVAACAAQPTLDLLGAVLDTDAYALLRPAIEAEVVVLNREHVQFTHPLFASGAHARGDPERIRRLHNLLADLVAVAEERARHLALATVGPDESVARVMEESARAAFARGAPAAAAELAGEARRLTPPELEAAATRRAFEAAEFLFEAGDTVQATVVLEGELTRTPPGPLRARLLSRQARLRHFGEDVGRGVELLLEALTQAGGDDALRAEIEEGLAWGMLLARRDLPMAAEHARAATRFAERGADEASLAEALAAQALTELAIGCGEPRTIERALALEGATRDLRVLRHPSFAHGYLLSCTDEFDQAREVFRMLERRAVEHGDESALASILNHLAFVEWQAGEWTVASELADQGYARALQSGQRPSQASILSKKALIQACRGEVATTRETAALALDLAGGTEHALRRGGETALWTLGFLELSLGRAEQAEAYLGPLTRALLAAGIREPGELRCLPDEIEALVALGRTDEAEGLLEPLEKIAGRLGRVSAVEAAARCRGFLEASHGDLATAVAVLERATAAGTRSPLPLQRARTDLALGSLQRRAMQKRLARETLTGALASFEQLGSPLWAEKARAELGRIGGRSPSTDGMTTTERRVADLVVQGKSNKEAASALFVTVKTIEGHLSQIYMKLGVHSRAELARRLLADSE